MTVTLEQAVDSLIKSAQKIAESTLFAHQRLDFLENLLREREIHAKECAVVRTQELNSQGRAYFHPQPCNCWLSTSKSPIKE